MELGREFHSFALGWVKMKGALPFAPPPEIEEAFDKYVEWHLATVEEVFAVEMLVEDRDHGYRGRLDLVARLRYDRTASLIDLKRSYAVDRPTGFQLIAYRRPAERKLRRRIVRRLAILIPKDGPCRAVEFGLNPEGKRDPREDEKDWMGFLYCLNLRRILRDGAQSIE